MEAFRSADGFAEAGRPYDSALATLDLAAVLLARGKSRTAAEVVTAAAKVFLALRIERERLMAVLALRTAVKARLATRAMVEDVARYLRRSEHDPGARLNGEVWKT